MYLVDIENLEYDTFMEENGSFTDYISRENLHKAPQVDPVNHAKWIVKVRGSCCTSNKLHVSSYCSHCAEFGSVDIIPEDLWLAGYKDTYNPERHKYCRECGYKMDGGQEIVSEI